MIQASNQFIEAVTAESRQFKASLLCNGEDLDCELASLEIHKGASGDQIVPGAVFIPYIVFTVRNCSVELVGKTIVPVINLVVDHDENNEPVYDEDGIRLGEFIATKPTRTTDSITCKAVGKLSMRGGIVYKSALGNSPTLTDVITELGTQLNMPIILKGLTASGRLIKSMSGEILRDALSYVACILGGFATEDNAGNIVISRYGAGSALPVAPWKSQAQPAFSENDWECTGIKVVVSEEREETIEETILDEDGIEESVYTTNIIPEVSYTHGEPNITVLNPYMTPDLFTAMYPQIEGYSFNPGNIDMTMGDPRLEAWDSLSIEDLDGNTFSVPCLSIIHKYHGGLESEINGDVKNDVESTAETVGPLSKQIATAVNDAEVAKIAADTAKISAQNAVNDAGIAREAAGEAKATAESVHGIAQEAKTSADAAKTSADSAHTSAQSALRGLSQVEDVVGTLNWISEHGTYELTEDTEVQEGKLYFTRTTTYENLLPKVYHDTSGEVNGIIFAVNNDGSISMRGTSTDAFQFILTRAADNEIRLYEGEYRLSGGVSDKVQLKADHLNGETWISDCSDTGSGSTFTVDNPQSESIYYLIESGVTVDAIVYPTLYNLDMPNHSHIVVTEPSGNPSEQGWYELASVDEAVSNYIASHLALTNEGLYVLANDSEWKVLIASDGVRIINAENEVVSTFSSYMEIGKTDAPHMRIEPTMLSFYGTAEEKTFNIASSAPVREVFTQTLLSRGTDISNYTYVLTIPSQLVFEKLSYEPVDGTITLRMTAEDSASVMEHTFSSTTDTEFTLGQVQFRYSSEAQSIYGETRNLITSREVSFNSWLKFSDPVYIHPQKAGTITGGNELKTTASVIKLAGNPIRGTTITVECISLITKDGEWSFTAGTSATKTFTYSGYTFTAVYNAAANTISCKSNKAQTAIFPLKLDKITYETLTYSIENIELSYTREYLAPAFSLGSNNEHASSAICTSALGHDLAVQGDAQIAIGKYNDNQSDTAFEIGNGTHIARSNAYEVTEDGDIRLALDTNAGSGTDYEIYSALQALGWTDCIV